MKIVKIFGGLGNQMFQYAFALRLSRETGDEIRIDVAPFGAEPAHNGYELGRLFDVRLPEAGAADARRLAVAPTGFASRVRRKYFTKRSHLIDRRFGYQPELFSLGGDRYFEGYWQSEKYFSGIEEELRSAYAFRLPLAAQNSELLASMPRPVASVHVRRGDYLKSPNLDLCGPAYYAAAAAVLDEATRPASYLVFSDDIDYCRSALGLGSRPCAFVDWNRGLDSWQDMAMMSLCDAHIVANSSFSWWGAWLDPRPDKAVVAPEIWNRRQRESNDKYYRYTFDDIVPSSWLRAPIE